MCREAQGDPALLAFATVDLTFPGLPPGERLALRSALAAAAIPHWCDAGILAELVGVSGALARVPLARVPRTDRATIAGRA